MMNQLISSDCLTGYQIEPFLAVGEVFEYFSKPTGFVKITSASYIEIHDEAYKESRIKLAGLCRNLYEMGAKPPAIVTSKIEKILEEYDNLIPKSFEQKKIKILEYLIQKGGKEYREADIKSETDFTLVYGDEDELCRVMTSLETEGLIKVKAPSKDGYGRVLPTKEGIALVEHISEEKVNLSNIFSENEREAIFSLIEDGRIKDTLEFIKMRAINRAKSEEVKVLRLLKARLSIIQDEKIKGTITYEEARVNTMRLFDGILTMMN